MYDKIYCINLDQRPERYEGFQRDVVDVLGFDKSKFERISAIDTRSLGITNPGAVGCILSHIKAWDDMLANGYDSVLILEDDFIPTVDAATFNEITKELYDLHPNFSTAYISWSDGRGSVRLKKSENWSFMNNIALTSGYIITRRHIQLVYDTISRCAVNLMLGGKLNDNAIDMVLMRFQGYDNMGSNILLGVQSSYGSDIQIVPYDPTI
jgi:GR25 family glycosyltransferase involved in LPS biosynthesis